MKSNFHNKNFALSLVFIMRFKATRNGLLAPNLNISQLPLPENKKHAPRKLLKNNDDFLKMSLGKFGHNDQVFLSDSCFKQHSRASPYERPLKKDLTKILIICKKNVQGIIQTCKNVLCTLDESSL